MSGTLGTPRPAGTRVQRNPGWVPPKQRKPKGWVRPRIWTSWFLKFLITQHLGTTGSACPKLVRPEIFVWYKRRRPVRHWPKESRCCLFILTAKGVRERFWNFDVPHHALLIHRCPFLGVPYSSMTTYRLSRMYTRVLAHWRSRIRGPHQYTSVNSTHPRWGYYRCTCPLIGPSPGLGTCTFSSGRFRERANVSE